MVEIADRVGPTLPPMLQEETDLQYSVWQFTNPVLAFGIESEDVNYVPLLNWGFKQLDFGTKKEQLRDHSRRSALL
ncbi:MAG TPA: hypothetical protein V6D48_08350 [Oculatellaceae cyanobacterium]